MPTLEERNVTWQVTASVVGLERVQVLELRDPPTEPEDVKLTVPVGAMGLVLVSVTVAVQVESWLTTTGLPQETVVVVV